MTWKTNVLRNVLTVARYCLVLENPTSLNWKVSTTDLFASFFQKQSRKGEESTTKTRRPSKNAAAKFDIGSVTLIG